jgi:hypothetical protein
MKAKILITDDKGDQFVGEITLSSAKKIKYPKEVATIKKEMVPNFDMNKKAFIKQYGKGLSAPRKFVLLLAYLVKGEISKEKSTEEIKKHWNKLKSVLKNQKKEKMKFNTYYVDVAKSNNWIDSKKHGFYYLTSDWEEIFLKSKK